MGAGKGKQKRSQAASPSEDQQSHHSSRSEAPGPIPGSGDGYVLCELGHEHWGIYGAAGLMLRHVDESGQERYLLTHRSEETHHGDTYSIPGGARNLDETPEEAADRESHEELEGVPRYQVTSVAIADHGGWAYHTVHADANDAPELRPQTWETERAAWFTPQEINDLPLHPDFRIYWESL